MGKGPVIMKLMQRYWRLTRSLTMVGAGAGAATGTGVGTGPGVAAGVGATTDAGEAIGAREATGIGASPVRGAATGAMAAIPCRNWTRSPSSVASSTGLVTKPLARLLRARSRS